MGFRAAMLEDLDAAWTQRCADRGLGVDPDVRVRRRVFGRLLAQARGDPKLATEAMDQVPCLRGDAFYEARGFDLTVLENRIAKLLQLANEARREKRRREDALAEEREIARKYGAAARVVARVVVDETRRLTSAPTEEETNRLRLEQLRLLKNGGT